MDTLENSKLVKGVWLSQNELAARWQVSPGTIINRRDAGHLPFFRLPGSNRVLYRVDKILEIENTFTTPAKEVPNKQQPTELKKKKPVMSAKPQEEWRI